MPRLIWVFARRTGHFVGFVMWRLIHWLCYQEKRSETHTVCVPSNDSKRWGSLSEASSNSWHIRAMSCENLFMLYANNKGADQPEHPHSLISASVVRCLDSIIPLVSISEISSLYLASVVAHASLCFTWSQTQRQVFFWRGSYLKWIIILKIVFFFSTMVYHTI